MHCRRAQAEAEALKAENKRLKAQLAQLQGQEGDGEGGKAVLALDSGGRDLLLDQAKGKGSDEGGDGMTTPTHGRKESGSLPLTPPDSGLL